MNDLVNIENKILIIRGQQVMLDRDLVGLYGVETKVLNQAVKRNIERFPERFMFQLTNDEQTELVTNCDRFRILKHSVSNSYVFTEIDSIKDLGKKCFGFTKLEDTRWIKTVLQAL